MLSLATINYNAIFGQLLLGLINGAFYAILSLGLSVIFGLLRIVNFAHGAQYMLGALLTWMMMQYIGLGYWWSLLLAPLAVAILGIVLERLLISKVAHLDHLYGLLLTFGLALVLQGTFHNIYGSSGLSYPIPPALSGGLRLPFMFLPYYRAWVVLASVTVCLLTWYLVERTKFGSYLRAATENPALTEAFGINVPLLVTFTYGLGTMLAAFAGVLAAPIYSVNPMMGTDLIIVVFAVVVIGGMGSIMGSIVTGLSVGLLEGLTKVVYPEASSTIIFVLMVAMLFIRPNGLFGKAT